MFEDSYDLDAFRRELPRRYLRECAPRRHATLVVDNTVLAHPTWVVT